MVALITGASGGIGTAIARRLHADGYTVALHYHSGKQAAENLAAELDGMAFGADLADFAQIDRMTDAVHQQLGSIDLLVCNAGVSITGLYQDISDEEAMRLFAVNVGGVMHTAKRVLPGMLRRHSGNIITVSSIWGEVGAACEVHYSASKAAVIGFTKALAKEVGLSGIRVNCVSPGVIDTPMNAMHGADTMAELADETPLGRIGSPEEIAAAVSFLASEQASFITGQVLPVNGGFGT